MCSGCFNGWAQDEAPEYEPMSPEERAEISARAGRPLTENQALSFLKDERIRRMKEQLYCGAA